ncbi:potassium transporter TrkG [Cloacibacillus sp. An23]|uniref:TrkH family potassium uptake protein n=1 Tax=Cloacibacillus sp. An23 TaxID=1965591 RepID=UPI001EF66E13|nr:potassium transporter TrkG [Cloacibacillus sp. An23]
MAGAFLLWLSNNFIHGLPLSPVDALFMATSAVCVTGLSVLDLSKDTGIVSQLVLLALIQIGGLGIMTGMMLLSIVVGRRVGIKGRIFFLGGLGVDGLQGAVKLFFTVIKYTFAVEGIGALVLLAGFLLDGQGAARSLYLAVFHSVSSFCNAGFSPCPGGLQGYRMSIIVPGAAMLLIILGGIGFPVAADFAACWKERGRRLTVYSKLVVIMTLGLVFGGAALLLLSDWNVALRGLPAWAKVWNALFASVTTRTAGYDTVAPGTFSGLGQALMIVLMLIGASPASTGGGVKTTTFGVLAVSVWSELHGRSESTFLNRSISPATERRSLSVVAVYLMTMLAGTVLLTFTENMPCSALIFETASALATTGLSVGITPDLSTPGKLIVTTLMFWGRVGLYTFISTLVAVDGGSEIRYPETHVPIG